MDFKRILTLAALATGLTLSAAPKSDPATIKASDERITIIGRTMTADGDVSFDWTGTYARIRFKGSCLTMTASDTKKNYYNVWMDSDMKSAPDKVIAVAGTDTTIVLFSQEEMKARFGKDRKAAAADHQVIIQKRTEGEQGRTTIKGFTTDGEFLQADAPKDRIIEFIGDSYTCGYGSENSVRTDPFTPETENQNKTYACIISRYFNAEQIVVAHSGWGIARNYNGKPGGASMVEKYQQTFDLEADPKWDAASCGLKPAITVIYLGTNDFSTGMQPAERLFVKNYIQLMKEIKDNYGENYPILCVAPKNDILMLDYIRKAYDTCGLKNIHIMALTPEVHNSTDELGASYHPNYAGHLKKAYAIIPYISTIMGWEMAENEIR